MNDLTIPVDDLIQFLKSIEQQCKSKGTPYFSKNHMIDFYDIYGDEISSDGSIIQNTYRLDVMSGAKMEVGE